MLVSAGHPLSPEVDRTCSFSPKAIADPLCSDTSLKGEGLLMLHTVERGPPRQLASHTPSHYQHLEQFLTSPLLCQVPTHTFTIQFEACSFAPLVMPQINAHLSIIFPCEEDGWTTFRFSKVKGRIVLETPKTIHSLVFDPEPREDRVEVQVF